MCARSPSGLRTFLELRYSEPGDAEEGMLISSDIMRQNSGCKGERGLRASGRGKAKGRSPVPWEVWELRPKCPAGTEGGKPRPDYCLPNLTPWSLSVVSIRCSAFKARFDAGRFLL